MLAATKRTMPRRVCCEKNTVYVAAANTGRINIPAIEITAVYHWKLLSIRFIKNGIPAAKAVQSKGVITSRIGSFVALQLNVRKAPMGIKIGRAHV